MNLLFDLIATQNTPEARFHGGGEYAKQILRIAINKGIHGFYCVYNPNYSLEDDLCELIVYRCINMYDDTNTAIMMARCFNITKEELIEKSNNKNN